MSFELQEALDAETVSAVGRFDELLDFAAEATLRDPTAYHEAVAALPTDRTNNEPDDIAISKLGMWATIRAIDEDTELEADELIKSIQDAGRAVLPIDPAISRKIEVFGRSILGEAFVCLGADADEKAAAYRRSTSERERLNICNWLARRLSAIHDIGAEAMKPAPITTIDTGEGANVQNIAIPPVEDKMFYHPARLSPRFIGQYPEIALEPTCLGVSILAASFFERTGTPYLHCGVVRTAIQEARNLQIQCIMAANQVADASGHPMPDQMIQKLQSVIDKERQHLRSFTGFHAAILAYVSDETWAQVDPNYRCNTLMDDNDSKELTELHQMMVESQELFLGLEFAFEPDTSTMGNSILYKIAIEDIANRLSAVEEVDAFLASLPEEAALESIYQYFDEFFSPLEAETAGQMIGYATRYFGRRLKLPPSEHLQDVIYGSLLSYVFPDAQDGTIQASITRCHHDASYRLRRAEDLALAPIYALLALQSRHANAIVNQSIKLPHSQLEAGLPAYRIGAAVLSDFASYCGDELPLSFWLTYWPSEVSFAEHFQQCGSPAQIELRKQIASDRAAEPLKYYGLDDIVSGVHE